jgi:myo-inositol-1(or 4)-monophosphatase
MTDGLQARHDFAVELAIEAGKLAASMHRGLGSLQAKSAIDFCTEADLAVERLVTDRVHARFGDGIIGEEYGGEASESVWLVDPIDGTTEYIHGTRRWCVSLSYVRAGVIEAGVIYAPADDRLFSARRGAGAFLNGRRLSVSRLAHGAVPIIEVGWSARRAIGAYGALLERLVALGFEFRRHGSGALAMAEVAAGLNDGYVELHINAWDALAGILLVQEAGGRCNDFLASGGLTGGNLLVAGTPEIWEQLTAAVLEVTAWSS